MPIQEQSPTDQSETIAVTGPPTAVATLPAGYVRWRFPISAPPSNRWKLSFQDPLGGLGRTVPRTVSFDGDSLILETDGASLPTWQKCIEQWIEKANKDMEAAPPGHLHIVIGFLPECSRWYWELRHGAEIVESSWRGEWMAYPSRTEAATAAAERLKERQAAVERKAMVKRLVKGSQRLVGYLQVGSSVAALGGL